MKISVVFAMQELHREISVLHFIFNLKDEQKMKSCYQNMKENFLLKK